MAKASTKKIPISLSKLRLNRLYESLDLLQTAAYWYQKEKLPEQAKKYPWLASEKRYKAAVSDAKEIQKFMDRYDDAVREKVEDEDEDW